VRLDVRGPTQIYFIECAIRPAKSHLNPTAQKDEERTKNKYSSYKGPGESSWSQSCGRKDKRQLSPIDPRDKIVL